MRDYLYRRGTSPNNADHFVFQVFQVLPCVVVIPASAVKGKSLKCFNTFYGRQLRLGQRAVSADHKASLHMVAAISLYVPKLFLFVPDCGCDGGLKHGVIIEIVILGDRFTVIVDLKAGGIVAGGDIARLIEQR